jgi:uncharacterized spore protein YtfJ
MNDSETKDDAAGGGATAKPVAATELKDEELEQAAGGKTESQMLSTLSQAVSEVIKSIGGALESAARKQ